MRNLWGHSRDNMRCVFIEWDYKGPLEDVLVGYELDDITTKGGKYIKVAELEDNQVGKFLGRGWHKDYE